MKLHEDWDSNSGNDFVSLGTENSDRSWVSHANLMTLMLGFFVLISLASMQSKTNLKTQASNLKKQLQESKVLEAEILELKTQLNQKDEEIERLKTKNINSNETAGPQKAQKSVQGIAPKLIQKPQKLTRAQIQKIRPTIKKRSPANNPEASKVTRKKIKQIKSRPKN